MKFGDKQIGTPQVLYRDSQADIEAIVNPLEGAFAYANDTNLLGYFDGSDWIWVTPDGVNDHGLLTGLGDDDHSQYHTDGRADTWLAAKAASYYPASETITYGTKTAGGYADLAAVGGTDMAIQEANGANAMQFVLGFTSVALAPNNILIYGNYNGGANHQIEVSAYNYVSAAYEHMGFITVETAKHWYSFPIFNGTSFIDGSNNASLRFRHVQSGVNTHNLYLDYVALQHTLSVAGSGGVTDHGALQNLDHPDHPASAITVDAAGFSGNLGVGDTDVQTALETLDAMEAGPDATAVHTDQANEISGLTEKVQSTGNDIVIIEDAADGFAKKKVDQYGMPLFGFRLYESYGAAIYTGETYVPQLYYDAIDEEIRWNLQTDIGGASTAADVTVDTGNFDNNLSAADDTVQKALDTLDDLVAGGNGGYYEPVTTGDVDAPELVFADGDVVMVSGSPDAFGIAPTDGWTIEEDETWTYASSDDPTYAWTIPGDKTSKYSPGMRARLTQTTVKYFIITKVEYSAPNTTVTAYGGTDYDLANAAITNPYYSHAKAPAGFPLNPAKWSVIVTDTTQRTKASPVAGTWYYSDLGSINISMPIGVWDTSYQVNVQGIMGSSTNASTFVTLSTSNNSESDKELTVYHTISAIVSGGSLVFRRKFITTTTKITYYLLGKVESNGASNIYFRNDNATCMIQLISAYL